MEVPVRSSILLISTTGYDLRIKGLASVRPFFFGYKCSHAGPRPSHSARLRLRTAAVRTEARRKHCNGVEGAVARERDAAYGNSCSRSTDGDG